MKFPRPNHKQRGRRHFLQPATPKRYHSLFSGSEYGVVSAGREAMACHFEVRFSTRDRSKIGVVQDGLDEIDRLEGVMSAYRDDSDLAETNRMAALHPVHAGESLFTVLKLSKELWNRTGGAFDITAGPLSKCWGFYERDGEVPSAKSLQAALEQVGTSNLDLDEDKRTVFFRSPLELNLGAIGKGFALDCAAAKLKDAGLDRFLFHAGHSSLLARGTAPGQEEGGWRVGIRNPLSLESDIGTLSLRDQAMSISGIVEQGFKAKGVRYGHILDPRTGVPAENHVLSAVIAPTAAEADALSTAFFVMSLEEIQSYCRTNPGTGAVIVRMESRDSNAEVHSFGLEDNHLEVLTKHEL